MLWVDEVIWSVMKPVDAESSSASAIREVLDLWVFCHGLQWSEACVSSILPPVPCSSSLSTRHRVRSKAPVTFVAGGVLLGIMEPTGHVMQEGLLVQSGGVLVVPTFRPQATGVGLVNPIVIDAHWFGLGLTTFPSGQHLSAVSALAAGHGHRLRLGWGGGRWTGPGSIQEEKPEHRGHTSEVVQLTEDVIHSGECGPDPGDAMGGTSKELG